MRRPTPTATLVLVVIGFAVGFAWPTIAQVAPQVVKAILTGTPITYRGAVAEGESARVELPLFTAPTTGITDTGIGVVEGPYGSCANIHLYGNDPTSPGEVEIYASVTAAQGNFYGSPHNIQINSHENDASIGAFHDEQGQLWSIGYDPVSVGTTPFLRLRGESGVMYRIYVNAAGNLVPAAE